MELKNRLIGSIEDEEEVEFEEESDLDEEKVNDFFILLYTVKLSLKYK